MDSEWPANRVSMHMHTLFAFNFQNILLDFNSETRYILCSVHILFLGKSQRKDNVRCEGQEGNLQSHASQRFSSVQSLSHVCLFATPWIAACQASMSITNSRSSLKLMSIESVMPSSHLILCHPLLLLPPTPPSSRVKVLEFQL